MLKLMYITNRADVAKIAEKSGVDRIFIDMEYIGKSVRQGGMDTVQCHHTVNDIKTVRKAIEKSELLVRSNPIHEKTAEYSSSEEEIEEIINAGADVIMLPYFKTAKEVEKFLSLVDGRAKTMPLLETADAVKNIDDILSLGIDEIHIGLNDLSLCMGYKFMFGLLEDGTVERLAEKIKNKNIPFGFGGIAALGKGFLPAEHVIMEHYRLGSTRAILSRSFCDVDKVGDITEIEKIFDIGLKEIRDYENFCMNSPEKYAENKRILDEKVIKISEAL